VAPGTGEQVAEIEATIYGPDDKPLKIVPAPKRP
jgi:hypothetical protein